MIDIKKRTFTIAVFISIILITLTLLKARKKSQKLVDNESSTINDEKKRSPESLQLNSTYAKYTTLSVEGAKASELSNLSRSEQINSSSASEVTDNSHSPRSESKVADVVLKKTQSTVFNQFSKNWRKYNPTLTKEEFKTHTSNWFRRAGTKLNSIKKSANQIEKETNDPQIDNFI